MQQKQHLIYISFILLLLTCFYSTETEATECDTVAVVVASDNPLSDISSERLRYMFLGKVITFSNNMRIQLLELESLTDFFYRVIIHKTAIQVRKEWLKNIFSGRDCLPPTLFLKPEKLLEQIKEKKGAIGFLPFNQVDDSVKVLSIDGKLPDDSGYTLIKCNEGQEKP